MSFFDQPYYALTKGHMSRIGVWPEQSKNARIIRQLTALALAITFVAPRLARLNDIWEDTDSLIHDIPLVLTGAVDFLIVLRLIQHFDKIKLSFENMERHWEMFKNTSAVVVLDKYAERGRCIVLIYSMFTCIGLLLYCFLCLSPIILDVINPLNETRSKIFIFHTENGIDKDKYYWFILVHDYIVTMMGIAIAIAVQTVYYTWAVHACALFEVVNFNLKLRTNEYTENQENYITRWNDWNYKKICDCITIHEVAISLEWRMKAKLKCGNAIGLDQLICGNFDCICVQHSFAELIESICSGPFATTLCCLSIMIVFTGIQALIYSKHRNVVIQSALYIIAQVFNLLMMSVPGQELINHSEQIHTNAYDLEWPDMSVKAQKLLIPIMIRSNKPCCFTARKVYILSLENFGSTIRTVISYFMIFAQMI